MAISPIFLKFGVLRVANVNSWHIDFQVNRTNRFRAVAIGIWMIFFFISNPLSLYDEAISFGTEVELRLI